MGFCGFILDFGYPLLTGRACLQMCFDDQPQFLGNLIVNIRNDVFLNVLTLHGVPLLS